MRLPEPERWASVADGQLRSVANWATSLLQVLEANDPLKFMRGVNEDILGVYQYDARSLFNDEYAVNRATIRIYWGVIGLVANWLGCSVEDLTIVVLIHELSHAYTQLGADIGGRRWPAAIFSKAEIGLKEGLAQYYTERVLYRHEQRYSGAIEAYQKLLKVQSLPYQTHKPWVEKYSSESVRRAMLEVRSWQEGQLAKFQERLFQAQHELHPNSFNS